MNDVTAALAEYKSKTIGEAQLMRRLLSYRPWYVPCDAKDDPEYGVPPFDIDKVIAIPNAKSPDVLPLFSDGAAFDAFRDATASPNDVAGACIPGYEFFAGGLEGVDAVVLNPGTPDEWMVPQEKLDAVSELADAIEVERAWERMHTNREATADLALVARYAGYYVAVVEHEGRAAFCQIADDHDQPYMTIFTHRDALELALPELQKSFGPPLKTNRVSGKVAFPIIAKEQAAGFVVNYLGPTQPVAFRLSVTELLLAELAKGEP